MGLLPGGSHVALTSAGRWNSALICSTYTISAGKAVKKLLFRWRSAHVSLAYQRNQRQFKQEALNEMAVRNMLRGVAVKSAEGLHLGQRGVLRARSTLAAALPDATSASALETAKPFHEMPGPKALPIVGNTWRFLKGIGTYGNTNIFEQLSKLREEFGDIVRITDILGRQDQVWVYKPEYVETILRNEGRWPFRMPVESLHYYRTVIRKDYFQNLAGTMTTQGEEWHSFRSKVNQPMMQPRSSLRYLEPINEVADDLLQKMEDILDENRELPANFITELHKWSLESVAAVALDTRLGCLDRALPPDSESQRIIDATHVMFDSFMKLDWEPSLWRLVSTPTWRRFVKAMDTFTDVADKYIQQATQRLKQRSSSSGREPSILERLLTTEGPAVANLMASDMLFGGVDTTSNLTASLLFLLANNPGPQEKLAEELKRALPDPKGLVTPQAVEEMPYLKACVKESLRIFPIVAGNFRRTQSEIVLGGYRIPKDTDIFMGHMVMTRDEQYFPRPLSFEPERWLRGSPSAHTAHPFTYLPFGFGPRTCVGRRIAELEVHVLTAKILRNFKLEYHYGNEIQFTSLMMNNITNPLKFRLLERH